MSPKLFHGANLLLTPLSGLTEACRALTGDNMFISFGPPKNFSERIESDEGFYENLPEHPSIDAALRPQIYSCPGYEAVRGLAPAEFWCSMLNPDGYLNCQAGQASELSGLSLQETEAFIENLKKHVEPAGLFASGLAESLAIQLERAGLAGSAAWRLITEGRAALLSGKLPEWGRFRGFGEDQIAEAMRTLRGLDPAPGRNFTRAQYIAADVEFVIDGGQISPRIVAENLPSVESHLCEFDIKPGAAPSEPWMRGEWNAALRALKLLGLRCRAVMRCARYIASVQKEKILDMRLPPKPMTYASAGAALSLHASTLYRFAHGVYCLAGGRTFPMSVFFSRAAAADKKISVAELRSLVSKMRADGMTNRAIGTALGVPERTVAYHSAKLKNAPMR